MNKPGQSAYSEVWELAGYLRRMAGRPLLAETGLAAEGGPAWRMRHPDGDWAVLREDCAGFPEPASELIVVAGNIRYSAGFIARQYSAGAIIIRHGQDEVQDGLPVLCSGIVREVRDGGEASAAVTIHDRLMTDALQSSGAPVPRPLAIISTYNEADVVEQVIEHYLAEDVIVRVLDNWSSDGTWERVSALAKDRPRVTVERCPADGPGSHGDWASILQRKQEIAARHPGRWIMHSDADELRRSPFPGVSLGRCLSAAQKLGYSRIDFTVMNFLPVAEAQFKGRLAADFHHFQFGSHASHFQQKKCWLQGNGPVDLVESGGHIAEFPGARDFPYKFLLMHYPIRSAEHGRRKVLKERQGRWSGGDLARGWHTHYVDYDATSSFLWPSAQLHELSDPYQPDLQLVLATDLVVRRMLRGGIREAQMVGATVPPADELVLRLQKANARLTALEHLLQDSQIMARDLNAALVGCLQRERERE